MEEEKYFVWLAATTYPRRGPILEKDKIYSVADFDETIVAYWVEQGAARYVSEKEAEGGE